MKSLLFVMLFFPITLFSQDYVSDTLAVRAILDSNGYNSTSAEAITDSSGDRITKLSFKGSIIISTLSSEIGQLDGLKELYCTANMLTGVPPEIGQLTNLESLKLIIGVNKNDIAITKIASLPPEIGNCAKIKTLECFNIGLESLPGTIINLEPTEKCKFALNCLDSTIIPDSIIAWLDTYDPDWAKDQIILPNIISATASDNNNILPGVDNDDYVLLTFNHSIKPTPDISSTNIDTLFPLSGGHSWLDGEGGIGSAKWNYNCKELTIYFSTVVSPPTIALGDTTRYMSIGKPVIIGGSFGPISIKSGNKNGRIKNVNISTISNNKIITIHYSILYPDVIKLEVFDIMGKRVKLLIDDYQESGDNSVKWYGNSSGVYYLKLRSGNGSVAKKAMVVK